MGGEDFPDLSADRNHASGETIELYAMKRLTVESGASVEEHLLICQECRDRLEAIEHFLKGMRGR